MIAIALALLLAQTPPNAALDADYQPDEESWNGLGYLVTTAKEARVDLEILTELDLDTIAPEDTIILVYPTAKLPTEDLLAFVDAGGYLVVADDRGSSGPLLEKVGIALDAAGPTEHSKLYQDMEGFDVLEKKGEHFLFFNLKEVVTNYPAVLRTLDRDVRPILSFDGGREHLIVEAPYGSGAVLALSDPSMFLNEMQRRFYGNKQLAANVLRFYCHREPCTARLLLPSGKLTNHFDPKKYRLGTLPKDLAEAIAALDESLADASTRLADPPWAWLVLGVAALGGLILGLRAVARFRRPFQVPLAADVRQRAQAPALDDAIGLVQQRGDADFASLSQTLGEQGLELVRAFDLEALLKDEAIAVRERSVLSDAMLRVRAEAASLGLASGAVPSGADGASASRQWQTPVVTAERFMKLHADVELLTRFARGRRRVRPSPTPKPQAPLSRPTRRPQATTDGDLNG